MRKQPPKKKVGTNVETATLEAFKAWCKKEREYGAQALDRAMQLYMILPEPILKVADEKRWNDLKIWFGVALDHMEIEFGIGPRGTLAIPSPPITEEERMRRITRVPPFARPLPQTPSTAAELLRRNENVDPIRKTVKDAATRETTKESQPAKGQKSA